MDGVNLFYGDKHLLTDICIEVKWGDRKYRLGIIKANYFYLIKIYQMRYNFLNLSFFLKYTPSVPRKMTPSLSDTGIYKTLFCV